MNANKLKGLMLLALPLIFACVSQVPAFPVTTAQQQQLEAIYYEADRQARELTRINAETVTTLLQDYDGDVQTVLNAEQWVNYDDFQRDYWARVIVRDLRRGSGNGSVRSPGSSNVGSSMWTGTPGVDFGN